MTPEERDEYAAQLRRKTREAGYIASLDVSIDEPSVCGVLMPDGGKLRCGLPPNHDPIPHTVLTLHDNYEFT